MFDISFHTNVDNKKQLFSYVLDDVIIVRKDYPQILKIKKDNYDFSYLTLRNSALNNYDIHKYIKDDEVINENLYVIENPCFLLFDDYFGNYLHYIVESLLKLKYFILLKKEIKDLKLLMFDYVYDVDFIKESFKLYLGDEFEDVYKNIIFITTNNNIKINRLLIPNKYYLWPDTGELPESLYDVFNVMSSKVNIDTKKNGVYISRQDTIKRNWWHNRNLQNEIQLIESVKNELNYDIIELMDLNLHDKIKIFKTYKNIIQTNGASMINLVFCEKNTNFHMITHPIYGEWSNPILRNMSYKLNVNFYEYNYGKIDVNIPSKCGNRDNVPWEITDISNMIREIKNNII